MTLQQAAKKFEAAGLDKSGLEGQEEAFQTCLSFLEGVEKGRGQNRQSSYGLKHLVEDPSRKGECYNGYIYEGTFILAALASDFTMRQRGRSLKATFNLSHASLRKRAREFAQRSGKH